MQKEGGWMKGEGKERGGLGGERKEEEPGKQKHEELDYTLVVFEEKHRVCSQGSLI